MFQAEVAALVVDNGSDLCKAAISGDDALSSFLRCIAGPPRMPWILVGAISISLLACVLPDFAVIVTCVCVLSFMMSYFGKTDSTWLTRNPLDQVSLEKLGQGEPRSIGASTTKTIFLIRHAESTWNSVLNEVASCCCCVGVAKILRECVYGHVDHPLSEHGRIQASELNNTFSKCGRTCGSKHDTAWEKLFIQCCQDDGFVYCSPMQRALQTALLTLPSDVRVLLQKDLREIRRRSIERDCLGAAKGPAIALQSIRTSGLDIERMKDVDCGDCASQWWDDTTEDPSGASLRIKSCLERILDSPSASIICVTHSNWIKQAASMFDTYGCCSPTLRDIQHEKVQNCGVVGLRFVKKDCKWYTSDAALLFHSTFEKNRKTVLQVFQCNIWNKRIELMNPIKFIPAKNRSMYVSSSVSVLVCTKKNIIQPMGGGGGATPQPMEGEVGGCHSPPPAHGGWRGPPP